MSRPREMTDFFTPGILLSETHFGCRSVRGLIAAAVERVAAEGFFRGIEIADVTDAADQARIGRAVLGHRLRLTYWTSMILNEEKLSLCALQEDLRKKTVARLTRDMAAAAECAAVAFAVLSGPDPGPPLRAPATEQLHRSLCEPALGTPRPGRP
jgi:hypothetical protein